MLSVQNILMGLARTLVNKWCQFSLVSSIAAIALTFAMLLELVVACLRWRTGPKVSVLD